MIIQIQININKKRRYMKCFTVILEFLQKNKMKKAISEKYKIRKWIEEKRSGTVDFHKRNLGKLIEGDTLAVTEISRLGRSLNMIFDIIKELQNKKVRVMAIKNNFEKKNDITAQVLMLAFGLSAQIERDLISERTKQGLIVAKSKGKAIGRRKGEMIYNVKLRKIMRDYKSGMSINTLLGSLQKDSSQNEKTCSVD